MRYLVDSENRRDVYLEPSSARIAIAPGNRHLIRQVRLARIRYQHHHHHHLPSLRTANESRHSASAVPAITASRTIRGRGRLSPFGPRRWACVEHELLIAEEIRLGLCQASLPPAALERIQYADYISHSNNFVILTPRVYILLDRLSIPCAVPISQPSLDIIVSEPSNPRIPLRVFVLPVRLRASRPSSE